jgi:long-chain fatty acid transport protein
VGFGSFTPFGLSDNFTNFNDGDPPWTKYPGRFAGTRGRLEVLWLQPAVAYRLNRNNSVSLGVAVVHTHLLLEQSFLNPLDDGLEFGRATAAQALPGVEKEQAARMLARLLPEGRSRVAGTADSPGFTLGYLYKHRNSKTNIGLMFRSAVTHHLKGKASFAFTSPYPLEKLIGSDLLPKAFPNQDVTGSFTTPGTFAFGVSNGSRWNTLFSLDVRVQDYRRFRSVALNFSQTEATNKDVRTPAEKRLIFDFNNAYAVALGMEKRLNPVTALRAGYMFDHSPVPDKSVGPVFPDTSRHSFTFGGSRQRGNMELTIFYQAVKFLHRTTNVAANANIFTNGDYRNFVHTAGLGFRFGGNKERE